MIRINASRAKLSELRFQASNASSHLLFGPFVDADVPADETLSFRSSYDTLKERPGIFGENYVNHRKLDADLYISALSSYLKDKPEMVINTRKANGSVLSERTLDKAVLSQPTVDPRNSDVWYKLTPLTGVRLDPSFSFHRTTGKRYLTSYWLHYITLDPVARSDGRYYQTSHTKLINSLPSIELFSSSLADRKIEAMYAVLSRHSEDEMSSFPPDNGYSTTSYFFDTVEDVVADIPFREVMFGLDSVLDIHHEFPEGLKTPGDLVMEAVETLDSNNINMFELLQGFKNPKELIPQLKNLSKLKTHAGNYLGVQYGILPTMTDLQSLWESISAKADVYTDGFNHQVLTAGHRVSKVGQRGTVTRTSRIKIAIDQSDSRLKSLSERMRNVGFFPSVNNLWELVPYSFVIDWFVNIGDMLEEADSNMRVAKLPVVYCTTSTRTSIVPLLPERLKALGVTGSIEISHYSRSVSSEAPSATLNFEVSNELPNHWLEAGALIVAARK